MPDEKEQLPLDARMLSEAIIELNISRRNVSIYPRGHPSVEKSLEKVFDYLKKLFELRSEITLAVAKDTLIVDNYFLDRKNPVYMEFALHLSDMNIAYVTFISGLTKDELYEFHRFISEDYSGVSSDELEKILRERKVIHIKTEFIDYGAFSFREGKTEAGSRDEYIWERYIHGLMEGTLKTEDISDEMHDIPPDMLAMLLNRSDTSGIKEEAYDKVITTYMRKSSERVFSSKEIKRLMDFINGLRPELKKQFLTSTVKTVSKDMETAEKALSDMSVEKVIDLLTMINEQKVSIPDSLKNLLDKLSRLHTDGFDELLCKEGGIVDDIFISPDVMELLVGGDFNAFVTETYSKDIQKLLNIDASAIIGEKMLEIKNETSDENLDRDFSMMIHELISLGIVSEEEYKYFVNKLNEQTGEFLMTGQYGMVLKTLEMLESNAKKNMFPDLTSDAIQYYSTPEFVVQFMDSLRIMGRQARVEALLLCEHLGERILPSLFDALTEDNSQAGRRFFISTITQLGEKAVHEAIKRLSDDRWYVKRNMLFILAECGGDNAKKHLRIHSNHEKPKVRFEAIKGLLKAGDGYGMKMLKDNLHSGSSEIVEQAILLCGSFRLKECIPDLLRMLKKRVMSGADLFEKIPVVRALGEIGDPSVLVEIRDIVSSKSLLFKGVLEELKEEVYKTLKKYPYETISDLADAGIKSKNNIIREESLRLKR